MSFIIQEIPQPTIFEINTTEAQGAGGAIVFEVGTQDELFFEGDASADFSLDVIFDPTTSLDTAMQDGDIVNISLKVKNGSIPYALTEIKVDGTASGLSIAYADDLFTPISGVTGDIANYDIQITKRQTNTFDVFVGKSEEYSDQLILPAVPIIGSADLGPTVSSISLAFTPASSGGTAFDFEALSTPSGITATGSASPIVITGLTQGTSYTFQVRAQNPVGSSPYSSASNSKAPGAAAGQQAFTTPGTFSWVAPAGVTSVSVVAVGGGGLPALGGGSGNGNSGAGAGLAYKNNITVSPGTSYTVVVANRQLTTAQNSSFTASFGTMTAGGGDGTTGGAPSGSFDGGGTGGAGTNNPNAGTGGGGAAGYSGNGGFGGFNSGNPGSAGAGGGGGGGAAVNGGSSSGGGGGGVGILGEGANGAAGTAGGPGGGGSGGASGSTTNGGLYGGGGAGSPFGARGTSASGAVRIIWAGDSGITRAFPATNTGDL